MERTLSERPSSRNSEAPWDSFDSLAYLDHNYRRLREDDRQILLAVRDFFTGHFRSHPGQVRGIDVGAGTNLYPALAMLPWCSAVTLLEHSAGNVEWLERQIQRYETNWDEFWRELSEVPEYAELPEPWNRLAEVAEVEKGDIFTLEPHPEPWGVGTMFFVAESLSTARDEFESAVSRFLGALTPGAPFAAAFMENSEGYDVADLRFPAYPVDEGAVRLCMGKHTEDLTVRHIDIPGEPLRTGYTGMLLAWGHTA